MSLSYNIRKRRKELNLTLAEVAKIVGVTEATVQRWESGNIKNLRQERISALADALQTTPAFLMGWDDASSAQTYDGETIPHSVRIPVLGRIPAGVPLEAIEEVIDWEEISPDMVRGGKQYFALQIKGDSMEPEYLDGDVIIVLKQEDAETGEDVVVMVNGYDATFKRISKVEDGIILRPINPKYNPLPFSAADIQNFPVKVLGVCVELRRKKR